MVMLNNQMVDVEAPPFVLLIFSKKTNGFCTSIYICTLHIIYVRLSQGTSKNPCQYDEVCIYRKYMLMI